MKARRYDGGFYLCGYAVELALKARICKALGWAGYPDSGEGADKYRSFRVHDLEVLLHLTGREAALKGQLLSEWSWILQKWDPSVRYKAAGYASGPELKQMIDAVEKVLKKLL